MHALGSNTSILEVVLRNVDAHGDSGDKVRVHRHMAGISREYVDFGDEVCAYTGIYGGPNLSRICRFWRRAACMQTYTPAGIITLYSVY
jgi:hypothetical protein